MSIRESFLKGLAIPAMPLALNADRSFDEQSQRALLRYYVDSAVGGIAVGVHSTQFAIRDIPGFYNELMSFTSEVIDEWALKRGRTLFKIAGISGARSQAIEEATMAKNNGYHAGLLSLVALTNESPEELIEHARSVSEVLPVIGFYLQTAVGGRVLPYEFWKAFAALDNVLGIKMAPFNRYATLDVIRGVVDSGRGEHLALYTGNDDTIVSDLLTPFPQNGADKPIHIVGGLLGHWGVWTSSAVKIYNRCREIAISGADVPQELLSLAAQITDMNAAVFDPLHAFSGCIPGIHEVLRRQGLFQGTWCLNPEEKLSQGQSEELTRVIKAYPHLVDDEFVADNLSTWRS